jgi:hypothetical protein
MAWPAECAILRLMVIRGFINIYPGNESLGGARQPDLSLL